MNHKRIAFLLGLVIIAAVVGGVVYWEWPARPGSAPQLLSGPPPAESSPDSATLWIGLKNSDDQGTNFDLRVELYKNATLLAVGETPCIRGVTRNPDKAKEVAIPFGSIAEAPPGAGDLLGFKVLTRIGTNPDGSRCGGHSNAVGLRLYYDVTNRPSRFSSEIFTRFLKDYFLHSNGTDFLGPLPPALLPTKKFKGKFKDSPGLNFKNGNPWREIGRWSTGVFEDDGYVLNYDSRFEVGELDSARPAFIRGKLFKIPDDMPNLSIGVYENPSLLPVSEWYHTALADKEYTFPDSSTRSVKQVMVGGVLSLEVRSNVLGYVQLRTFIPHDDKIFGVETTVPDDVEIPRSYFLMLESFSFLE